ncbi:unnamed protein product [Brachionus calyciflorus]|uniref:ATP synthase peripheral stalk subunit OSCP, mitochondrial n=1 Tax=Brachionus calyciflorus TaxID=104777 RepID=A0A813Z0W3_9BILA|nr:unnamed protein product [Brachionus calyciflorus]
MANRQVCGIIGKHIRSFSTTTTQASANALPIQLHGIEGRYAHAIYSAALKQKSLEAVDKDFQAILTVFKQEKGLNDLLRNPLLTKEQRQNAVNELATKRNANKVTVNTLSLLAENGRLGRLEGVAKAFGTLMSAHRGEVQAKVTTAHQLSPAELKELQSTLQAFVKKGHTLQLVTKVDASLIGGMVVELGDRYVDLSLSSKLKTFTNIVKETL